MIPPLLLAPRVDFRHDASLSEFLGARLHACMQRENTTSVLAVSKDATNAHFLISSVAPEILRLVCTTFARQMRDNVGHVRVILLAFPSNICLVDARGKMIVATYGVAVPALTRRVAFSPLKWSNECTEILRHRKEHMVLSYQRCQLAEEVYADLSAERDELKKALADELVRNEQSASMLQKEVRRRESLRALNEKKDAEVGGPLARNADEARALVRQTYKALRQIAKEHKELKAFAESELRYSKGETVEVAKVMQLVKIALQCNHYFTVDRFSSPHFRKHIRHTDRGECIPVDVLSEFPRLRLLCDGDKVIIGAACALLELCVRDGCVYF